MALRQLSGTDRAILDLERTWWQSGLSKAEAIAERFDFSETHYQLRLGELVAERAAYAYDPLTVRRLRKQLERRRLRHAHGPVLTGLVPHGPA